MSDPLRPADPNPQPVPDVWPPPPSGLPPNFPPPVWGPPPFAPLRGLATALTVLLGVYAALALLGLVGALLPPATVAGKVLVGGTSLVQAFLLLGTGVCFLVWTYRLVQNLRAFGVSGLKHSPGWAVAYFFIPILSLYRPYQIFREVWQGSDPDPAQRAAGTWHRARTPALLGFWWCAWILTNVLDALSAQSGADITVNVLDNAIAVASSLLALWVVRRVTARQEGTALALGV